MQNILKAGILPGNHSVFEKNLIDIKWNDNGKIRCGADGDISNGKYFNVLQLIFAHTHTKAYILFAI